jgi:hypothetical protein
MTPRAHMLTVIAEVASEHRSRVDEVLGPADARGKP